MLCESSVAPGIMFTPIYNLGREREREREREKVKFKLLTGHEEPEGSKSIVLLLL
jgi:hypothetical protein